MLGLAGRASFGLDDDDGVGGWFTDPSVWAARRLDVSTNNQVEVRVLAGPSGLWSAESSPSNLLGWHSGVSVRLDLHRSDPTRINYGITSNVDVLYRRLPSRSGSIQTIAVIVGLNFLIVWDEPD
jgi:hypothetical protein